MPPAFRRYEVAQQSLQLKKAPAEPGAAARQLPAMPSSAANHQSRDGTSPRKQPRTPAITSDDPITSIVLSATPSTSMDMKNPVWFIAVQTPASSAARAASQDHRQSRWLALAL